MDEELKAYLRKMEDRAAALIASEFGSLHTGIQNLEKRLDARFDSIDSRLDGQAALLQSALERVAIVNALERKAVGGEHGNGAGKT